MINYYKGVGARQTLFQEGNQVMKKKTVDNYSLFQSLETIMLPQSQIQITLKVAE